MPTGHPAKGFTWFLPPMLVRVGSWQAKHICPPELSRTRKFMDSLSTACTWGLWQEVHSTLPLTSCTAPVLSPVLPAATRLAVRSILSCIGLIRLKACELCNCVPKLSPGSQLPRVGSWPKSTVSATATVPSWQLRQRALSLPSGICWLLLLL